MKHTIPSENFKYKAFADMVNEFMHWLLDEQDLYTPATKQGLFPRLKRLFDKISDTDPASINADWIISMYKSGLISKTEIPFFAKFIVYLAFHDYRDTEWASLLQPVSERADHFPGANMLPYILTCGYSIHDLNLTDGIDRFALDLFFHQYDVTCISDLAIQGATIELLESIRLSSEYTPGSALNSMRQTEKVIFRSFSNVHTSDINREFCLAELEKCRGHHSGEATAFMSFVCLLIRKKLIHDSHLEALIEQPLCDFILRGCPLSTYRDILSSDYIGNYYVMLKSDDNAYLVYTQTDVDDIRDAMRSFIDGRTEIYDKYFYEHFTDSLNGLHVTTVYDLSFSTFVEQVKYFNAHNSYAISTVVAFYLFLLNVINPRAFDDTPISAKVLSSSYFTTRLREGYSIVHYAPLSEVPSDDRWILCYAINKDTTNMDADKPFQAIDFSLIQNPTFRTWYKNFVWKHSAGIYTKVHMKSQVISFFNYIDDLKAGRILSIRTEPTLSPDITLSEIVAYKDYIEANFENNRTFCGYIYAARMVLNYVKDSGLAPIPDGAFYYLTATLDSSYDNNKAIPNDDLEKLNAVLQDKAAKYGGIYDLYYLIFFLGLETKFRISHVLALTADCVRETAKPDEYVLYSKEKTGGRDFHEQPISIYTKQHLDRIKQITDPYRAACNVPEIKKQLFISPSRTKKNAYASIAQGSFREYMRQCCKEANIPVYTYKNLRSTHMTKAYEYKLRNRLSDMELTVLTGHVNKDTDNKHYLDYSIEQMLESIHGIIIGDVNLQGEVTISLPEDIATQENSVSDQCGYCKRSDCNDYSYLDCMLCKSFATTIDRLPYFKERMVMLDKQIQNAEKYHDKECLVAIKRLVAGYMSEIMKLMQQEEI